ncbi:MAG: hypothetical protein OHK93_005719 [Ramalina farinacea]|uniref:Heterokaryon incompatibility domain-containing protein n=1 Tax=Ramalina farinacea TaxID=258253 RepID=A0AA43QIW8_9LECA|nr:hypothetical protein [Ramalina farinacea]
MVRTHDATEMVVRLKASSWVRRLWTFHEAYLARELHYQFKDGALRLSAILGKYHQGSENPPPIPTGHETERIKTRIEGADPVWWSAYRFLEQVEVLGKDAPQEDHARLRSIIHPLRWRTTSRIQDETICLSGCIDRTVEDLPFIPDADPSDLAIERMKTFLSSLQTVPLGLLFVQRPHIEHDGCRWMPTSFLGGGMDSTLPDPWQKEDVAATGRPTPSGLVVALPGIMLSDVTDYTQDFRGGHTHDIIFIRVNGRAYYVYGLLTEPVQWRLPGANQLAIVLREELDERGTFGCLVSMIVDEAETNLMDKEQVWCVG